MLDPTMMQEPSHTNTFKRLQFSRFQDFPESRNGSFSYYLRSLLPVSEKELGYSL